MAGTPRRVRRPPECMETPDWYRQLTETCTVNGVIGGSLLSVINAEESAGNHLLKKYRGQNVLLDSFQSFFIDTLTLANDQIKQLRRRSKKPLPHSKSTGKSMAAEAARYANLFLNRTGCANQACNSIVGSLNPKPQRSPWE